MSGINTRFEGIQLRFAEEKDTGVILGFIKELAEYENLLDEVSATEDILREALFSNKAAEVILAEIDQEPVGFALFFHNFSTFLGKAGIYLEDLYVKPEKRGRGIGKLMLAFLARVAIERNCGRLEWSVLDWNKPSIEFYKSMGAVPMEDWTVYRVTGRSLQELGDKC